MQDTEHTLTSPSPGLGGASRLLALTIVWHPAPERVGEQYLDVQAAGEIALGRYLPLFRRLDTEQAPAAPLGERCLARTPLRIWRLDDDSVHIQKPDSRMRVECEGAELGGTVRLEPAQLECGVILGLGGAVQLCLHWMDALPLAVEGGALLGVGAAAIRLRRQVRQAAGTGLPVLLLGPSGTGKEVAAQAIHAASAQARGPLVAVNMAGLSETLAAADLFGASKGAYTGAQSERGGYFAEADGGTLFLDEIGDTPAAVQPMLLRVLESGQYRPLGAAADRRSTARLIAATDRDLDSHAFNQPLLRRLEAFVIEVPALRRRREDLGVLIVHFWRAWMRQSEAEVRLPSQLVSQLCQYDWPGNIRQLAHVVRRICIALHAGELPQLSQLTRQPAVTSSLAATARPDPAPSRRQRMSEVGEGPLLAAMEQSGWQIRGAARLLGISRPSLYKLLAAHPLIRRLEAIPADEIQAALRHSAGDVERCASALKTPSEPLRRFLNAGARVTLN